MPFNIVYTMASAKITLFLQQVIQVFGTNIQTIVLIKISRDKQGIPQNYRNQSYEKREANNKRKISVCDSIDRVRNSLDGSSSHHIPLSSTSILARTFPNNYCYWDLPSSLRSYLFSCQKVLGTCGCYSQRFLCHPQAYLDHVPPASSWTLYGRS